MPHPSLRLLHTIPPNARIFSLIQPTGKIHIGNYLGALSNWKHLANSTSPSQTLIFGVADLHALTVPRDPADLKRSRRQVLATILAAGISPEKCCIYFQSSLNMHTELAWYLTCLTSMGLLNRMTQYKEKGTLAAVSGKVNAGIFTYPILMAADILLHRATHVPVGHDQVQHLELARLLADSFAKQFGTRIFPSPQPLLSEQRRILLLRNTASKMSKSDPKLCLFIYDDENTIASTIKRAVTDSIEGPITYDPVRRPGVSNLINIVLGLLGKDVASTVAGMLWMKSHSDLKTYVADMVIAEFRPQRNQYMELVRDTEYLEAVSARGHERARVSALETMNKVREAIGLAGV